MLENKNMLEKLKNLLKKIDKPGDCSVIKVPFKVSISLQGTRERLGAFGVLIHSKGVSLFAVFLFFSFFFFCATVSFRGLHKILE
jgi:hypothetical protein